MSYTQLSWLKRSRNSWDFIWYLWWENLIIIFLQSVLEQIWSGSLKCVKGEHFNNCNKLIKTAKMNPVKWTMNNITISKLKLRNKTYRIMRKNSTHLFISLNLHVSSVLFSYFAESIRHLLHYGFSQELSRDIGQQITDHMFKLFKSWGGREYTCSLANP